MITKEEKQEAITYLRSILKPGDTVTTTVLHVSRSGMMRTIMCQAIETDRGGKPRIVDISWAVARAIGAAFDRNRGGVKMGGCGMNMCFETVYDLGYALFPDGFAPSNMAHRPSDGKLVNVDIGRGMKRSETIPFALDREWIEKKRAAGFKFSRGRCGDVSGWDDDGGYALKYC